ncbi:TPA: addiction module antidote protein [Stenotrophomonas maltophilia]
MPKLPEHRHALPRQLGSPFGVEGQGEALAALGDLAREHGLSALAVESGVTRLTLYKALSEEGNPKLDTFLAMLEGLGLRLQVVPVGSSAKNYRRD